jgi:hypothetical protein
MRAQRVGLPQRRARSRRRRLQRSDADLGSTATNTDPAPPRAPLHRCVAFVLPDAKRKRKRDIVFFFLCGARFKFVQTGQKRPSKGKAHTDSPGAGAPRSPVVVDVLPDGPAERQAFLCCGHNVVVRNKPSRRGLWPCLLLPTKSAVSVSLTLLISFPLFSSSFSLLPFVEQAERGPASAAVSRLCC